MSSLLAFTCTNIYDEKSCNRIVVCHFRLRRFVLCQAPWGYFMAISNEMLIDQLRQVHDPELHRSLVDLGMVKDVQFQNGVVDLTIELTTPACPLKGKIQSDVESALHQLGDEIKQVRIHFTADVKGRGTHQSELELPGVSHIIAVGAGKGGVGKSSVAVNLAIGLAREGAAAGLLDGDIYGPSIPTMLGLELAQPELRGELIVPFERHGIKSMSLGALVEEEKPLIWRGPMAHNAFTQLISQTDWGKLDYLVIDLPPGTGDVPLTMCQLLDLTGAVIVCTPQKVAQDDARRAVRMFQTLNVPILGIIENMSYFIGDDGKEYDIFGKGGVETMAGTMDIPFLGSIPISMAIRRHCDEGNPGLNFEADDKLAEELKNIVSRLAGQISIQTLAGNYHQPTIKMTD